MPAEMDRYSAVVGAIYEAALDAACWDDAILSIVEAYAPLYWDVGFLVWERAPRQGARFVAAASVAPHARELYAAQFAGRHPWSRQIALQPVGRVIDTDDICPRAELYESDLFKHFLSTWALVRALAVVLDRELDDRLALVIAGPDGQDIERLRRGLRLIAPHLQRAVRISQRIAGADLRASAAEASLEMSTAGVVSLRADMSVVNANPRALKFIESGLARIARGYWRFADSAAQAQIERLATPGGPKSAAFTVTTHDGDEPAVLAVRIATQSARVLDGFVEGASILLTVGVKGKAPTIPIDHLAAWYGFTPTEALLAAAIADGDTVAGFALRRGVTENAVRFVMKGVLRKADAADQARLVAALRALPVAAVTQTTN